MRAAIVSTYPPRPCGIATFAHDVTEALQAADATVEVDVLAIVQNPSTQSPPGVFSVIHQDVHDDYRNMPAVLDDGGVDVVLIEHEFGIYGGIAGSHLLSLVRDLRQPFVLTLHTVLSEPSPEQCKVLQELCARAAFVTVFTETARRMVVKAGLAEADRLRVVPHGAPVELFPDFHTPPRANEPSAGRRVLSTFGLISEGKGIEVAIRAVGDIVRLHPEVIYLIAGQTHPEVAKEQGERYRVSLERLVAELGLTENVRFLDHFLSVHELADLLASTDVYLTPYRGREQIVSGALTFAVVAGCPVVSTPYYYAEDLLSSGAGVLVPFDDHRTLARAVCNLLDDPATLAEAGEQARRVGADLAWPAVGRRTLDVLREAVQQQDSPAPGATGTSAARPIPAPSSIRIDHLLTLVDDVGIIQHADGVIPLRATGYCVDDVARLVIVALGLSSDAGLGRDQAFDRMVTSGLSFLRHAWVPDRAAMHNFLSYDRSWVDQPHSGDHVGRAIWALGSVIAARQAEAIGDSSMRLLRDLAPAMDRMDSLREIAFAIRGLCRTPLTLRAPELFPRVDRLAGRLLDAYSVMADDQWRWFENTLTYDNARLPQALLAAGERLDNQKMIDAGLASLDWYAEQCTLDTPIVRLPGNSWLRRGDHHTGGGRRHGGDGSGTGGNGSGTGGNGGGDEQPLDAAALAECCVDALRVTGTTSYGRRAVRAFEWFLGRNGAGVSVYDSHTGGCHDGLGPRGVNENEGAESTLAYFQARLALNSAGLPGEAPQA